MASSSTSNTGLPHAPHGDDDNDSSLLQNYSMNGKIIISALGILFCMVFVIILLHMYSKWCWRRRSTMHHRALSRLRISLSSTEETFKSSALDKAVVEALPIFTYTPQLFVREGSFGPVLAAASGDAAKAAECAVCLGEFRQDDVCKLLPNCKHFFHVGCIDMWFLSYATCPLCRATPGLLLGDEEAGYSSNHAEDGCCGDEQGKEAHKGMWCVPPEVKYTSNCGDDEFPLNMGVSSQARKWRRSFSDKFPCTGNDHASMAPPMRERSLTCDNLRCQDSLGAFSSCSSISCLVSPPLMQPREYAPPLKGSKSLTRVFSK